MAYVPPHRRKGVKERAKVADNLANEQHDFESAGSPIKGGIFPVGPHDIMSKLAHVANAELERRHEASDEVNLQWARAYNDLLRVRGSVDRSYGSLKQVERRVSASARTRVRNLEFHKIFAVPVDVSPADFVSQMDKEELQLVQQRERRAMQGLRGVNFISDRIGVNPKLQSNWEQLVGPHIPALSGMSYLVGIEHMKLTAWLCGFNVADLSLFAGTDPKASNTFTCACIEAQQECGLDFTACASLTYQRFVRASPGMHSVPMHRTQKKFRLYLTLLTSDIVLEGLRLIPRVQQEQKIDEAAITLDMASLSIATTAGNTVHSSKTAAPSKSYCRTQRRKRRGHSSEPSTILCFGTSIVAGFHGKYLHPVFSPNRHRIGKAQFHSFDRRLNERLVACGSQFSAQNISFPGKRAHQLLGKLRGVLARDDIRFHCCVLLAGTNDVMGNPSVAAEVAFKRLCDLYKLLDDASVPVVVVINPDCDAPNFGGTRASLEELARRRKELARLADLLKAYALSGGRCLVDARNVLPLSNTEYWDDAIHPSPAGSNVLGDAIFEAINETFNVASAQK